MNSITPYLFIVINCCVGPLWIFMIGIYLGRNGMPFELRRRGRKGAELRRYIE
jgi:hypothetical protein